MSMRLTIHDGELKRYAVLVRCTSHRNVIWNPEVLVFATNAEDAKAAAVEKMIDKYLRHQSKRTTWITVGEPKEC
jgi:ABC-type iron transport system FetAB ATPase subunit